MQTLIVGRRSGAGAGSSACAPRCGCPRRRTPTDTPAGRRRGAAPASGSTNTGGRAPGHAPCKEHFVPDFGAHRSRDHRSTSPQRHGCIPYDLQGQRRGSQVPLLRRRWIEAAVRGRAHGVHHPGAVPGGHRPVGAGTAFAEPFLLPLLCGLNIMNRNDHILIINVGSVFEL